ncbi:hypothetical protein LZ198_14290 [Myxococcus sp. K15C18031901]|uniref:hypothetical protein n=1 Tax=Myxococcus dinghuensis TaxID=2906761 RepID=UPI0020A7B1A0|nr:hypothetical protein [Myxococcus dinghuensis]MCP3100042.1 hypothetical protein [Myxococcus dinghuensis]
MRSLGLLMLEGMCACATGTPAPAPSRVETAELVGELKPYSFLLGTWDAEGGGSPGASAGRFTFEADVQGHVLVRRNVSSTPKGKHEDLVVLYVAEPGVVRASYFDNEGHVIQYGVRALDSPPGAEFVTAEGTGGPRFRLTNLRTSDDTLLVRFEVAPPGGAFRTYLEGTARRR